MKKIAFICGGNSAEREISCLTALKVCSELEKKEIPFLLIYLDENNNFNLVKELNPKFVKENLISKGKFIHKNNNNYFQVGLIKYKFDYVLTLGHGKNIEEGCLKSFFSLNKIPYIGESIYNGVILQDKSKFKMFLKTYNLPYIPYQIIYKYQIDSSDKVRNIINKFSFPLIIKPATLGSSIGLVEVNSKEKLKEGLYQSAYYDDLLLVEPLIKNKREINIALLGYENDITISQLEEVNHSKNILSFYDKYDYSSANKKRIIAPEIDVKIKERIIEISKKTFSYLHLCGVVRFDFIIDEDSNKIYLNEANLIPGSLAYYLFEDQLSITQLVEKYVELLIKKNHQEKILSNKFKEGFINKIDLSKLKK